MGALNAFPELKKEQQPIADFIVKRIEENMDVYITSIDEDIIKESVIKTKAYSDVLEFIYEHYFIIKD